MRFVICALSILFFTDVALNDKSLPVTYLFELTEKSTHLLLPQLYLIQTQFIVNFMKDGRARIVTNVINISQHHFSVFINKQNCGLLTSQCFFYLGENETLNVDVYRIDSQSRMITFTYEHGKIKTMVLGCPECLKDNQCVTSSSGADYLAFCQQSFGKIWLNHTDKCLNEKHWWNNLQTTTTTKDTTTQAISTTEMKTIQMETTTRASTISETTRLNTLTTNPSTEESSSTMFPTLPPLVVPSLKNLSDSNIGSNNVTKILNDTLLYSTDSDQLNSTQLAEIVIILQKSSNVSLHSDASELILTNIDNVLNVHEDIWMESQTSAQELLQLLPTMVHNTQNTSVDYLNGSNMGFSSRRVNCSQEAELVDGMADIQANFRLLTGGADELVEDNSIKVPVGDLCSRKNINHVFFTIYRKRSLFVGPRHYRYYDEESLNLVGDSLNSSQPPTECSRQTSLLRATPVMSATLLDNHGIKVSATVDQALMAIVRFNVTRMMEPLHGEYKVTWWDIGRKEWADNRHCQIASISDGIVEAHCIHLTDFAIIVDAALNDPNVCNTALMDLGYAVNSISILSLLILVFIYTIPYIKPLHDRLYMLCYQPDFLALIYHLILLIFYLLFTIFADANTTGRTFCPTMAAIMYGVLISSIILTMLQGVRIIVNIVTPKVWRIIDFLTSPLFIIGVAIAIPLILSILLLILTNFFKRQDCFCWVRPDNVIAGIIAPVSVLLLNTILCTSFVIYKMFFALRRQLRSSKGHHHYDPNVHIKIVSIIVMQISLGLPWILQFLTLYSPYTTIWHYLFTIIMGSQGTLLLLIYVYKYRRARQWQSSRRLEGNDIRNDRLQTRDESLSSD